jgi:hypothetical protein
MSDWRSYRDVVNHEHHPAYESGMAALQHRQRMEAVGADPEFRRNVAGVTVHLPQGASHTVADNSISRVPGLSDHAERRAMRGALQVAGLMPPGDPLLPTHAPLALAARPLLAARPPVVMSERAYCDEGNPGAVPGDESCSEFFSKLAPHARLYSLIPPFVPEEHAQAYLAEDYKRTTSPGPFRPLYQTRLLNMFLPHFEQGRLGVYKDDFGPLALPLIVRKGYLPDLGANNRQGRWDQNPDGAWVFKFAKGGSVKRPMQTILNLLKWLESR